MMRSPSHDMVRMGICIVTLLALVGASPGGRQVTPDRGGSLCLAGETPIVQCMLGGKQATVCGSGKRAIYRYGRPGRVELTAFDLRLARRGYSGGGETQIHVANRDYRYILFDRTIRTGFGADGRNDPAISSGLIIRRAGRTIATRPCDNDAPIPARATTVMPADGTVMPH